MFKSIILSFILFCFLMPLQAQEINCRVRIVDNQLPSTVDRKIFRTLESALSNFINKRKWTADDFKPNERLNCQFLINLTESPQLNEYNGILTIQVSRPVYQSSYVSPIINFQDQLFNFKYIESQPLEFNENRISGSDPLASNLTAVIAYYVYAMLGFDYDSFSPRGGDAFFQKALNIVNNAPEAGPKISGWKAFENGDRNRFALTNHLTNNRFALIHDVYYTYYRKGLDKMYEDEKTARPEILNALIYLDNLNRENPNLMAVQFFMLGKADELIGIFKKAPPAEKTQALELLTRLDLTNSNKYKQELK
jgi:Domain of unknown function (DUF4835)